MARNMRLFSCIESVQENVTGGQSSSQASYVLHLFESNIKINFGWRKMISAAFGLCVRDHGQWDDNCLHMKKAASPNLVKDLLGCDNLAESGI